MAVNNLKKKFVGDDQIDGDKILLEQGQAIRAKDASNVEQDILKFGPAGEVLIGAANEEVAKKDESVQKAGDTMSGNLTLDQSGGVTSVVSPQSIVFSDTAGDSVVQIMHGAGLEVSFTDNTSISVSANYYEGGFDLGAESLDSSTANGNLSADALAGIEISKVDFVDDNSSTLVLNSRELVFDLMDNATGDTYSSAFQHNAIVLGVQDGSGISQFQVFPNQPVQNMASDGSAPAPTLDTHLTSKKYVDDADQGLQDQIDALTGGGGGSISALQSELDDTQVGAGLEVNGSYTANGAANFISSATSLKSADELLDAALKLAQDEINAIEVGAGLDSSGQYAPNGGSNYLQSAISLFDADIKLDTQVKANADDIADLVTEDLTFLKVDGSRSMEANLNMMQGLVHHKIVGLGDPTDGRDAVNKQYVDAIAEGLHVHAPARLLANFDVDGTYNNGTAGVGAYLDLSASPIAGIDGVSSFNVGDRIIVAFQNGSNLDPENGVYYIKEAADINGSGDIIKLTRAEDFDSPAEMAGGDFIFVQSGTQYANSGWVMSETVTTVGTTPVKFIQFSGAGAYSAGDALSLTGTEFNVLYDNSTIGVNGSNQLYVPMSGIGTSQLANDSVTSDKIADSAVTESQISSSVAGNGIEKDLGTGKLQVKLDGSSLSLSASGLKSNIVWDKASFDLTATDITNGYVDLPVIAEAGSIIGFVDRLAIHEDQDFTVSEVSGKSRITFTGDLIPPSGSSPLDADDNLFFKFQKKSI